jgi:signal transduction histidine kinase
MYRELQETHAKLRELDEAKSQLFQNESHEFRAPLTLISGPVEAALEGCYGELSPEMREQFAVVSRNTSRLRVLIDDLLDLAKPPPSWRRKS